jgi:hypothetical protein
MAQLQSSYLPPGLTDEDVELALAAARGAPVPLQQPAQAAASQAAPADHVVPSVEPPTAVAENPYPEDPLVEMHTGGRPKDNAEAYTRDNVDSANAVIANKRDMGDEQGLNAEDHARMQGIHERSASQNKGIADKAQASAEARKAHEADMQKRMDALIAKMEANKQPPSDSTVSKVLGTIGSILAMGSNKPGTAAGVQMLMGLFSGEDEQQRWAMEQQADSQLYKTLMGGVQSDRDGAVNDLEVSQRMAALRGLEINDALKAANEMGLGRHATAVIEELQQGVAMKTRDGLIRIEEDKQKALDAAAAKAAAARAKSGQNARRDALVKLGIPALRELQANHQLDSLGHEVLQDLIKQDQSDKGGYADVASKQDKALGVGEGAGQEVMPGYVATIPLEKKDVSDIRTNAQVLRRIEGNFAKLAEIRKRNKGNFKAWVDKDDSRDAQNIISEMTGVMNQFAGRGAPSNAELEDMKEQLLDPTSTYWLTDPEAVYKATMSRLKNNFEAGLDAVGVRRAGGGQAAPAAAAGGSDPRIRKGFAGAVSTRAKPLSDEEILNQVRNSADEQELRDRKDDETQATLARFMR